MYWVIAPDEGHARKRPLQLTHLLFEVVSQRLQAIPDGGVLEAPGELAVTLRELAQIGDIGHGDSRALPLMKRSSVSLVPKFSGDAENGQMLADSMACGTWFRSERPNPGCVVLVSSGHWAGGTGRGLSGGMKKKGRT